MLEKIFVLTIIYLMIVVADFSKLKKEVLNTKLVYGVLMLGTLYLSLDYLTKISFYNLNDLFLLVFKVPAESIVDFLSEK